MQVFAAITSDAKLQIWDLSVSILDPVESYDTSVDDVTAAAKEPAADAAAAVVEAERGSTAASAKPTSAARYEVATVGSALML